MVVFDLESNSLLNDSVIDYTTLPYKLKDNFVIHCIVCKDLATQKVYKFVQDEVKTKFVEYARTVKHWIGHNSINFDHLVLKLYLGLDYTIGPDAFAGEPCSIDDTLIMSKVLNPDRLGHSLEWWGNKLGCHKMDWRGEAISLGIIPDTAPPGAEFENYHPRMLDYNLQDVLVTEKVYHALKEEWGNWDHGRAYELEKSVAEIITKQEHRGFHFDVDLARTALVDLDTKMQDIVNTVEPNLPPKKATKSFMANYSPPKIQFKKDGSYSAALLKFAEKIGGTIENNCLLFNGKSYPIPVPLEPLVTTAPMTLVDSTAIKEYLVAAFGWSPTSYKERDLTVDAQKKKINKDKFTEVAKRYTEQTLESPFCDDRCEHLEVKPAQLYAKLLKHDLKKPLKVLTNPSFTVGQDKTLCSGLEKIADQFSYVKDIVLWLTYRHRRNSILGGGADIDDEDLDKGYLSYIRADGRIPTPADTCGCNTSRMKHRVVANIPRVSSVYGDTMRALFGVSNAYLMGNDADGLEARITGHYIYKYDGGPEYAEALVAAKPNDVHTLNAERMDVSRSDAKTFYYAALYGAQPPKLAKQMAWPLSRAKKVFNAFWEAAKPIEELKTNLEKYWETVGNKSFILGIDGRKIPTRSKHSLLNSLFQSAGLICMKRAMVIADRELKEEGFSIDFFRDNRKTSYAQQLIAYHDETEVEVSKDLVIFKKFQSEEEAKMFEDKEKMWSDVIHTDKGYYRAYCKVGEIFAKGVTKAGAFYNLNVTLTSGYQIGLNWRDVH